MIWRDEEGVSCRRWNWRQGPRTRLTEETVSGVFLLEGMAPMPLADMDKAATELAGGPVHYRASASRTCSGVGAVPPRCAGIHHVSSGPLGRTG